MRNYQVIKKRYREKEEEPTLFHIVSGTSIGAINAAILVSYVKENRTIGSGQRLIDFWKYLSTRSNIENMNPYFAYYWDFWHKLDERIASGESARRYYSTKEFILKGVPDVFRPKIPKSDNRWHRVIKGTLINRTSIDPISIRYPGRWTLTTSLTSKEIERQMEISF